MGALTVIIPSKTRVNVDACVSAVSKHEPDARIIVVDDGVDWSARSVQSIANGFCSAFEIIRGIKPFIFARNVNSGIVTTHADVVLLNDDALLGTPRGFSVMQEECLRGNYGLLGSSCNGIGNSRQWRKGESGVRDEDRMVAFVCVFIPRSTIKTVGLLDERFVQYGFEDDDYCLRVRQAGMKIGICDGCYVDHTSLKSSYRGDPFASAKLEPGQKIFERKWGSYPL